MVFTAVLGTMVFTSEASEVFNSKVFSSEI